MWGKSLDDGAVAEIRAANTDTDEILGVLVDALSGGLNLGEFGAIVIGGQGKPTGHWLVE